MECRWRSALNCCFLALCILLAYSRAASDTPETVLVLGTANGRTNWSAVEHLMDETTVRIVFADLQDFGSTMKEHGFQAAIDEHELQLKRVIHKLKPIALVLASKGLNLFTHLILSRLYDSTGPVVLLSPVPNPCNHVGGATWEEQWTDSLLVLKEMRGNGAAPTAIGVGTSLDERSLIVDILNETKVCGQITTKIGGDLVFETCPGWFMRSFAGDHSWKNNDNNAAGLALLIKDVLPSRQMREKERSVLQMEL